MKLQLRSSGLVIYPVPGSRPHHYSRLDINLRGTAAIEVKPNRGSEFRVVKKDPPLRGNPAELFRVKEVDLPPTSPEPTRVDPSDRLRKAADESRKLDRAATALREAAEYIDKLLADIAGFEK